VDNRRTVAVFLSVVAAVAQFLFVVAAVAVYLFQHLQKRKFKNFFFLN
jgi:hypothetical protein